MIYQDISGLAELVVSVARFFEVSEPFDFGPVFVELVDLVRPDVGEPEEGAVDRDPVRHKKLVPPEAMQHSNEIYKIALGNKD